MSWNGKFKYEPMDPQRVKVILDAYKHEQIYNYILELYELIDYQKNMINTQRIEIISLKHKESWKKHDWPENKSKVGVDKPPKSGSMCC